MEAIAAKAQAARANKAAPPIRLYDVLFTIVFFGLVSLLTLLFIMKMA